MTPIEQWKQLIQETIDKIGEIDRQVEWQEVEPQWWLDMMSVRHLLNLLVKFDDINARNLERTITNATTRTP